MTTLMKDSGIDWIGEIPEGWKVKRIKDIFNLKMGETILKEDLKENGKIPVYSATIEDKFFGFVDESRNILNIGDIVIPARGNSIGNVKYVKEKGTSTQTTMSLSKCKHFNFSRYYYYYLIGNKKNIFNISGTAIPQITISEIGSKITVVPPLETQKQIADYLDIEVTKLDKQISLLEKKHILLGEYKDALIFETVTKGLDKNATMKDSGIDWVGEIPEGWKKGRLKDTLKTLPKSTYPSGDSNEDGEYVFYVSGQKIKKINKVNLEKDAILLATGGRFIMHYNKNNKCAYSTDVLAITSRKDSLSYLYYLIKSREKMFDDIYFSGTGIKHLQRREFLNCEYVIPPLETQKKIADYLDIEVTKLDKKRELIKEKVELLKQYKEALIFEVVTGKKEVE